MPRTIKDYQYGFFFKIMAELREALGRILYEQYHMILGLLFA
jgi:hypothetical protein